MPLEKAVYTAKAKATGGRDGRATSSDEILDVKLAVPKEMGGAGGGTNPEQLFAAGYSACFLGAMKFVAGRDKLNISKDAFIEGEGDKSLEYWKNVHWIYYSNEMEKYNEKPNEEIKIVCEYFETIW